jgi:hypothetical protein
MLSLIDIALATPAAILLLYVPLVCYLDGKHREVRHEWWIPLVTVNAPLSAFLIIIGVYQWYMLVISAVAIVLAFAAMKREWIQGADFMFIMFIVLFLQYNPVSGHWLMALPFFIFLTAALIITAWFILLRNILNNYHTSPLHYPRGIPLMLPISAALILTILLA